jgi:hypothetical protein
MQDFKTLIRIIGMAGPAFWGNDPIEYVAADWACLPGCELDDLRKWINARVWDARAAKQLIELGVTPEQVSHFIEIGGVSNTLGYWICNGDADFPCASEAA